MRMRWNIHDNEPDLVGGLVLLDGQAVDCVRRFDTEEGTVSRLHGDEPDEWHLESDCSAWGAGPEMMVPCEIQLHGDEIEVYNRHGERVA